MAMSADLLSRAGKSSTQRFKILKRKNSILQPRKKFLARAPRSERKELSREALDLLLQKELKLLQAEALPQPSQPVLHRASPSFRTQDRDTFYQTRTAKDTVPPCGHYNVSYSQVDSRCSFPPLRREALLSPEPLQAVRSLSPLREARSLSPRLLSPSPMALQLSRKPLLSPTSPNEHRFEAPAYRPYKVRTVDMAKALPRPHFGSAYVSPNYSVSVETSTQAPSFSKMSSRPPLFTAAQPHANYRVTYEAVRSQPSVPNFSKARPRELGSGSLPAYMQDSSSRMSLLSCSEKALRLNCTRDSVLAPAPSLLDYLKTALGP